MYAIDTCTLHALFACALMVAATCSALGFALLRSKRVGGLTFCKMGRLGFCFYFSKPSPTTVTNTDQPLRVVE
jgi:hypothetical protein